MITSWTSWDNLEYKDFFDELNKLRKRFPSIITKKELDSMSEEEQKIALENKSKEMEEYNKNPWINEESRIKGEELQRLREQASQELFDYCVKNRIFVSDSEHQGEDWGVPVFNNEYRLEYSLRSWSGLMAEVWNEIMDRTDLTYLDFYCNDADKVIKDYKKPVEDQHAGSMGPY